MRALFPLYLVCCVFSAQALTLDNHSDCGVHYEIEQNCQNLILKGNLPANTETPVDITWDSEHTPRDGERLCVTFKPDCDDEPNIDLTIAQAYNNPGCLITLNRKDGHFNAALNTLCLNATTQ